jgi:two-component system, chemotaxis family, sensor kinase CheA
MSFDSSRYLTLFVSEATEHLESLARVIVELEKKPTQEFVDEAFRHAHSLKGMSASMGFENTALLAHALEDVLAAAREQPGNFSKGTADAVLKCIDILSTHITAAQAGASFPGVADAIGELRRETQGSEKTSALSAQAVEVEKAPGTPSPRYRLVLKVSASSTQAGVRAFLAYKRLSALGQMVSVAPNLDDIRTGRIPQGVLSLELETAASEQEIRQRVSAVSHVSLESLTLSNPSPTGPPAEPVPVGQEAVRSVRVKAEDFDLLLDDSSEVLLATARLKGEAKTAKNAEDLLASIERVHALAKNLHQKVMLARLTPVSTMTDRWPRAVRDMARRKGREIEFMVEGDDVELDRAIIDALSEPLLHVLRNAVDHGLESPQERQMRGKDARGRIVVSVKRARDRVELLVKDNGRGFDVERLRQIAIERALLSPEAARALTEKEALMLACLPGVTTAFRVTDSSGRGVGMDAMKRAVESIGGRFDLESVAGESSTVRLSLPLTVAVLQVLLISAQSEIFGLPISSVAGVVALERQALSFSRDRPVLHFADEVVPVFVLAEVLGFPMRSIDASSASFVVVERDEGKVAFEVDALFGQEEAILKPLGKPLDTISALSGVTILSSGQPVFILDTGRLSLQPGPPRPNPSELTQAGLTLRNRSGLV